MNPNKNANTLVSKSILVLGAKGVGKTALIFQHVKNGFKTQGNKDEIKLESQDVTRETIEKLKESVTNKTEPVSGIDPELKLFSEMDTFKKELIELMNCKNPTPEQRKQLKQYEWLYKQVSQIMFVRLPTQEEEELSSSSEEPNGGTNEQDVSLGSEDSEIRYGQTPPASLGPKFTQLYLESKTVSSPEISRDSYRESLSLPISRRESLDSPEFVKKEDSEVLLFKEGIEKFANSHKEGIMFMKTNGFLTNDTRMIARFLIKTADLDKQQFGAVMGYKDSSIANAVAEYSIYYPFFEMGFEESLRNFLKMFILPMEGQQVARISDIFSDIYIKCKPKELEDPENAVLLTAAILMLNVSLHNPKVKVKDRLTKQAFLKILSTTKFSSDFLQQLYENIKLNEIKYNTIEKKLPVTKFGIFKKTPSNHGVCKSCSTNSFKEYVLKKDKESCLVQLCIKDLCSKHLIGLEKQDLTHYDVFLITYSVCDLASLDFATTCLNTIKKREKCILVATKVDDESRIISREKGLHLAMEYGISYVETSSIKNICIESLFQMALDLMEKNPCLFLLETCVEEEIAKIQNVDSEQVVMF